MKYICLLSLLILFSCNGNKKQTEENVVDIDLTLYGEIAKMDSLLKLYPSNMETLHTKGMYLKQLSKKDSIVRFEIDSIKSVVLDYYRTYLLNNSHDPNAYAMLGVKYKDYGIADSATYCLKKTIVLCDSILNIDISKEDIYTLKRYMQIELGYNIDEIRSNIKKDIEKNPQMKPYLEKLYNEISVL